MDKIEMKNIAGGALEEKFSKAFERVVENLQDSNTSFKVKRKIQITLTFEQNEERDDVSVNVDVQEKLAPQAPTKTKFYIGKDLKTGEVYAEEYGKQIKGQMHLKDYEAPEKEVSCEVVNKETGEVLSVVDFRKVAAN